MKTTKIMKWVSIITFFIMGLMLMSCEEKTTTLREDQIQKLLEYAYFEGQIEAIEGDVRIFKNNNGVYEWTKSPWDSGRKPLFIPDFMTSNPSRHDGGGWELNVPKKDYNGK